MTWRFEISNSIDTSFEVTPQTGVDFGIKWTKEDDRRYDFKKEIKDLTFIKDDFHYFLDIEKSNERCDLQTLNIYMVCGADQTLMYTGTFSMSTGKWDLDRCTVTFKVDFLDSYKCIDENDDDVNLFLLDIPKETISLGVTYGLEIRSCFFANPCTQQDIDSEHYVFYRDYEMYYNSGNLFFIVSIFIRHFLICSCDYNPTDDWVLLDDCSNGQKKYVKPYYNLDGDEVIDFRQLDVENFYAGTTYAPVFNIDNGMKLYSVLNYLLGFSCGFDINGQPPYTIVSDFFQWNPETQTTINYVTGELNKLTNLIFFQKSDVRRPNATNNATIAETNFIELLELVCDTFNLAYIIKDNIFRLEHVSWFEDNLGINLPAIDFGRFGEIKQLKGTKKYNYDVNKLPKYETFEMMEAGNKDFIGKDIVYNNNCVKNSKKNKKETSVELITTDVLYCLDSISNNETVSNNGFVLMACDENNVVYSEEGILESGKLPNNPLSWAHLHRDFWKHGRVFMEGEMNGETTEFISVIPTIKQDPFDNILQCHNIKQFNPLDKIKSMLGWGYVETAELKINQCVFNVQLLFDEIQDIDNTINLGDFDDNFNEDFD